MYLLTALGVTVAKASDGMALSGGVREAGKWFDDGVDGASSRRYKTDLFSCT